VKFTLLIIEENSKKKPTKDKPQTTMRSFTAIIMDVLRVDVNQQRIPNGANVKRNDVAYPGVGHINKEGDGLLDVFDRDLNNAVTLMTTVFVM